MSNCGGNGRSEGPRTSSARVVIGSVAVITCADDEVVLAKTLQNDGWDEYVLTGPDFESMGPGIEDLVVHAEGSNFSSSSFEYDVILQYKYRNGDWNNAGTALIGPFSTGAYAISNVFADRTKLGLRIRLVLRTRIKTGTSIPQKGTLNITVAVRRFPA